MKMKSKDNWTMRAAVLMFALVLITSSFVGGTFAKYVTSGNGEDSARVAKFGVKVTANGEMFKETYATDSATLITGNTVATSESGKKLVAPGTKGDMVSMTLTGKPEVAVKVSYEATTVELENWVLNDGTTFYCPLKFKIGSDTIDGSSYTDKTTLENDIKTKIAAYTKNYAPNTNLSGTDVSNAALKISWEWPFNGNDDKDTQLGDKAAGVPVGATAATVKLEIKTTVTQID